MTLFIFWLHSKILWLALDCDGLFHLWMNILIVWPFLLKDFELLYATQALVLYCLLFSHSGKHKDKYRHIYKQLPEIKHRRCHSDTFKIQTLFDSDNFQFWHFPIMTLFNSYTFQFWNFPILTLFNFAQNGLKMDSDTFQFWHFPISKPILNPKCRPTHGSPHPHPFFVRRDFGVSLKGQISCIPDQPCWFYTKIALSSTHHSSEIRRLVE